MRVGGLLALWLTLVSFEIYRFGKADDRETVDCIVVLGAAVSGESPSPVFRARIDHAIQLRKNGVANKLLFTGGYGEQASYAESEVAKLYALSQGISEEDILVESQSRTTYENLKEASEVMTQNQLQTAVIVSDPLHLKRASMMAKRLGLSGTTSPAEHTKYESLRTQVPFLCRELYFVHHFYVFNQ